MTGRKRTKGQKDKRTEGQKDKRSKRRRTEGQKVKNKKDRRTKGQKYRRTDGQKGKRTIFIFAKKRELNVDGTNVCRVVFSHFMMEIYGDAAKLLSCTY